MAFDPSLRKTRWIQKPSNPASWVAMMECFYNFRHSHQAMNYQMPMAVWRAGMNKIDAAAGAVEMPLRLENANALPTEAARIGSIL